MVKRRASATTYSLFETVDETTTLLEPPGNWYVPKFCHCPPPLRWSRVTVAGPPRWLIV